MEPLQGTNSSAWTKKDVGNGGPLVLGDIQVHRHPRRGHGTTVIRALANSLNMGILHQRTGDNMGSVLLRGTKDPVPSMQEVTMVHREQRNLLLRADMSLSSQMWYCAVDMC